ncbi:glycosyltransferase family protein [Oceanobacillus damuensis]|uniref:hypothetical protein n=1 Tax=Oceanobacillus damuensis TaxID=937928 RepID=UPI0008346B91|nr:hypothetical protein [Oceanobacillus damuensis]
MIKRKIVYSVIFCLIMLGIVGWFWTEGFGFIDSNVTGDSIEEAIFEYTSNTSHLDMQAGILETVEIDKGTFLVFTQNENLDAIHSSVVRKKWNGKWKVATMSGNAPIEQHPGETNPYYWTRIGTDEAAGYWGVIYDSNVETIVLKNNKEERADVLDLPDYPPIWYKVKPHPSENFKNIDMKAIDSKGEEVPWSPIDY